MDYENLPVGNGGANAIPDADQFNLVPEIAIAAAAAARTGGAPLLPDANGVVVLPAGATLDDIAVVGRDLVVTLDDGRVFVIPEGAVDVPQIVIDGVAVPPLNLAALLIGDQPIEPAAGLTRSSGNNFFEPAGDIQASFDIGDLLPPTDFTLESPSDDEEELQELDSDPTLIIVTPDAPVGGVDVTATVQESGLPARGGEPAGSNAAATTETTAGTIVFTSPDGIDTLTINGVAITATGQTIVSPRGTLTITGIDLANGTIGFTYTLTDNLIGGTLADQFTVILTDNDGDTATSTLTVNAGDDAPTARNDTDAVAARTFTAELGNVVTGAGTTSGAAGADTPGADGAAITGIASNAIPANTDTVFDGAGNLQVAGQYGTLLIRADGSYSYTRAAGTPGGVSDAFTYTLTDADGSASTATLTIAIADAAPGAVTVPGAGAPGAIVAESGLPARGGEPAGSNAAANTETTSGLITFSPGDGPATVTINGTQIAVGTVITTPAGTLTVTAFDPNAGTIGYTFTLTDNVVGDPASVTFAIVVTDQDGDSASGSLVIAITDDAPLAVNDSATQAAENAAVTVNVLANDIQGADGVAPSAVAAVPGTLTGAGTLALNPDGSFTYTPGPGEQGTVTFDYTITDGDGDVSRAKVTITLQADSTPSVTIAGDASVSEAALPDGSNAASADETASGTITVGTGGDTLTSLVINGVNVTAGGVVTTAKGMLTVTLAGGVYSYSYTLADNTLADPDSDNFTVTVTDSDGDTAVTNLVITIVDDAPSAADDAGSVAAGTFGSIGGNVLANDTPGADGAVVQSYSGVTSGNAGAAIQGQYGTLTIAADGSYSYVRDPGTPGGVSDTFSYTIVDGDGDTANANLVIAIADSGATLTLPPVGTPGATQVLEAGLPAGSAAAGDGEFATGSFSFAAPDGPATVTVGGVTVTTVGQTIAGSFGTLTITSIAAGSIGYSYQLTTRTDGDATSDSFAVVVADRDGDTASGSLAIAIVDDVPTARADIDSVREDGPTQATGNVLTGIDLTVTPDANATDGVADTPGADGATLISVAFNGATLNPGLLSGAYGTLSIAPNGSYRYTLNNANPLVQGLDGDDMLTETFTYSIRDGDGDTSTATLTITIAGADDGVTITGLNVPFGELGFNESNLPDGSAPNAAALTQSGSFTTAGTDGLATIVVGGVTVFQNGAFVPGQTIVTATGVLTITNVVPVTDASGDAVSATVSYSYTLTDNTLAHTGADDPNFFDSFGVTVTDSDGSSASATIDILIRDDAPTARFDSDSVSEDGVLVADGNVLTGTGGSDANATDGVADVQGADGAVVSAVGRFDGVAFTPGTLGAPFAGLYGSVTLNADGSYVYTLDNANAAVQGLDGDDTLTESFRYTITDGDGDTSTANLAITIRGADDGVTIAGLNVAGGEQTVLEANLADGSAPDAAALVKTGSFTLSAADGVASATIGGFPVFGGGVAGLPPPIFFTTPFGALTFTSVSQVNDASGQAVSITYTYRYELTDNTAHTAANADQLTISVPVTVTDTDGSTASDTLDIVVVDDVPTARAETDSIAEDSAAPATGNVITGLDSGGLPDANATDGVADTPGADGVTVTAVAFNPVGGGSVPGIVNGGALGAYGVLVVNTNGAYTYTLNGTAAVQGLDDGETLTETFTYTITDSDGDTSSATLTITINGSNDAPVVGSSIAYVSEEGLMGGIADAAGSADTTDSASTTGMITIVDPDGEATTVTLGDPGAVLTADGQAVTWSGVGTGTLIGSVGAVEVIRIAIDNTGAYTVTLSQSVDHPTINLEDNVIFTVPVSVSDGTVTVPTTLQIFIEDDSPIAMADAAATIEGGAEVTGNVLGNDQAGADTPPVVISVNGFGVGTIPGQFGTLTINADGSYSYTPNASVPSGSVDSFTYTMRDADGDRSTATLSITFQGDANAPTAGTTTATVDDDALAGGNPGGVDDDPGGATFSGTLPNDFGLDGPGRVTFAQLDGTFGTLRTESVQYGWNEATSTLTGTGARGALFTVVVDQATGTYTFTLLDNVVHTSGGAENNATNLVISYQVIDSDGSTATGTLRIDADDDTPTIDVVAGPDAGEVLTTLDASTIGAASDSVSSAALFGGAFTANASPGADGSAAGPATSYVLNVLASASGLTTGRAAINLYKLADGTVVGSTATSNPGAIDATAVFSIAVSATGVVTLTQFQQIDHRSEFPNTAAPFDDQFAVLGDGLVTLTATASITDDDGDTATDSATIDLGGNIRFADDGPVLTDVAAGAGVVLDETSAGTNFAAGSISATSTGAAITATRAFGADGPADGSIVLGTSYGLTITGGGATSLRTAIGEFPITLIQTSAVSIAGRYTDGTVKTAFTITIGADGRVTVVQNVALEHNVDGAGSPGANDPHDDALSLAGLVNATITIKDSEGDTATESAAIGGNIVFRDDGPVARTVTAAGTTDDEGKGPFAALSVEGGIDDVAGSPATLSGTAGALFSAGADGLGAISVTGPAGLRAIHDTNGDGKADQEAINYVSLAAADGSVTYRGVGAVSGQTVFTVQVNADGSYTFTQARPLVHAVQGEDDVAITFAIAVTDADGDTASGSLTVSVDDDSPSAGTTVATMSTDDEGKGPFPGIEGGLGDLPGSPSTATAPAGTLFKTGADGFGSLVLNGPPNVKAIYQGIASGNIGSGKQEDIGFSRSIAPDGSVTLTGRGAVTGDVVLVLTVGNDGSYTFTQSRALVHQGANESDLGLGFTFTVTDGDGDTKTGLLTVNVDDDTPIAFAPVAATALNTGTALVSGDLDTVGTGVFDNAGADGLGSLMFAATANGTRLTSTGGAVLTAGGADIFLYVQNNGTVVASTDNNPNNGLTPALTVFTATLSAVTGKYTMDFDRAIDGMGTKQFTLPVVLTDGDGDTSRGSIAVTVNGVVPVALDLDGDGVEFVSLGAGVTFDYNGDGTFARTSWVGGDDGILAFDGNADRTVDGGAEIVFGGNGLSDLEGLAAKFDGNHDGVLDANDADFASFGVWQDVNGNGKTDAGEFHTLAELGIAGIGLASDKQAYSAAGGDVQVAGTATFTRADGSTGAAADAAFTAAPLERMAARAAEAAAGNAAAAGYLVAAAAAVTALPVAASDAPVVVSVETPSASIAAEPAANVHVERQVASHELTAVPVKADQSTPAAHHAEPASSTSLSEVGDHTAVAAPNDAPVEAVAPAPAFTFTDGGGQMMEALLAMAQADAVQQPQDLATVQQAFGDSHGAALVDAVVDHFAAADAALPLHAAGGEALAGLLAGTVSGETSFTGGYDLTGLLDDHGATAAAQV